MAVIIMFTHDLTGFLLLNKSPYNPYNQMWCALFHYLAY